MPIICDTKPDEQLVVFRHIGDVPDSEFLTSYKEFFLSADVTDALKLLVDLRQTKSAHRSSGALQALSEFLKEVYRDSEKQPKVAIIAPSDLSFGLARMYEMFSFEVPWEFVVFRDDEAAQAWLDNPRHRLRP
jgi:hypothetical protein